MKNNALVDRYILLVLKDKILYQIAPSDSYVLFHSEGNAIVKDQYVLYFSQDSMIMTVLSVNLKRARDILEEALYDYTITRTEDAEKAAKSVSDCSLLDCEESDLRDYTTITLAF